MCVCLYIFIATQDLSSISHNVCVAFFVVCVLSSGATVDYPLLPVLAETEETDGLKEFVYLWGVFGAKGAFTKGTRRSCAD